MKAPKWELVGAFVQESPECMDSEQVFFEMCLGASFGCSWNCVEVSSID